MTILARWRLPLAVVWVAALQAAGPALAADVSKQEVDRAIQRGVQFLANQQTLDGEWGSTDQHVVGITSLALLALLNADVPANHPVVRKGLQALRRVPVDNEPKQTYEISLMIMALVASKDPSELPRIARLAQRLEEGQITAGPNTGGWGYTSRSGGDPSNAQFAILGLREAAEAGIPIDRETWVRAMGYWSSRQNPDGGWAYGDRQSSSGSMTVAGLSSTTIIGQMLQDDAGIGPDGLPPCCQVREPDKATDRAVRWMANHFSVTQNPGNGSWLLYYLYGMERAGRLTGRRFFGDQDWYRQGAKVLTVMQINDGSWNESQGPVVSTSFSLLFLSKGLAPVLVNKLKHGPRDVIKQKEIAGDDWNRHPRDVRNLVELISGLERWPQLLTAQEVDIARAVDGGGVNDLLQAPVLFLSGEQPLSFTEAEEALLQEYLLNGGFLFVSPTCGSAGFEQSFRQLLPRILPPGESELKPLPHDHPVYRAEYPLQPEGVELLGVDFGCRTSVIYCPEDLGCLWEYWARHDPPKRNPRLKARIIRSTQIGINVIAYATGREPPAKLDAPKIASNKDLNRVERSLLEIAKIRHSGGWDTAPQALKNLLTALNETAGGIAAVRPQNLVLTDENLFQYPLVYMHGRSRFDLSGPEREQLKLYLSRGGVLFADACCGARPFDKSFRELMEQLYPDRRLDRIPVSHELFSDRIGHDLKRVRRRGAEPGEANGPLLSEVREGEPFLEGIEVDGRYVVIYSKYDISCALERQSSASCPGYVPEDAVRIATNIVLYSLLQDVRFGADEAKK